MWHCDPCIIQTNLANDSCRPAAYTRDWFGREVKLHTDSDKQTTLIWTINTKRINVGITNACPCEKNCEGLEQNKRTLKMLDFDEWRKLIKTAGKKGHVTKRTSMSRATSCSPQTIAKSKAVWPLWTWNMNCAQLVTSKNGMINLFDAPSHSKCKHHFQDICKNKIKLTITEEASNAPSWPGHCQIEIQYNDYPIKMK